HNRAINRQKFDLKTIEAALADSSGLRHAIYTRLSQLIQLRTRQAAFHPDNPMTLYDSDNALLVLRRHEPQQTDSGLLCVFNLSGKTVETMLPEARLFQDVVTEKRVDGTQPLTLDAWQFVWLRS
ncbi:MAG: DUF3459 domain-containing protein, partial [Pantoea piersonii]